MAANYWCSSQRLHWQMSRAKLAETRRALDAQDERTVTTYPLASYRLLSIFFNQQLARLGRRMQTRQQALATAQLYVRRFYTKVPIRDTNPYLVLATCLYLALKMEECPQHIRIVVSEARTIWSDVIPNDTAKLAECEFYVISEMNSYLIVHHPYRMLKELGPVLQLTAEETNTSWQVINDSCMTDLPLIYPPHVIALTAIFLAVVLKPSMTHAGIQGGLAAAGSAVSAAVAGNGQGPQGRIGKLIEWYAESKVDMEAVIDATQEIVSLYEVWEGFTPSFEKTCKEQLARMVKQRGM